MTSFCQMLAYIGPGEEKHSQLDIVSCGCNRLFLLSILCLIMAGLPSRPGMKRLWPMWFLLASCGWRLVSL